MSNKSIQAALEQQEAAKRFQIDTSVKLEEFEAKHNELVRELEIIHNTPRAAIAGSVEQVLQTAKLRGGQVDTLKGQVEILGRSIVALRDVSQDIAQAAREAETRLRMARSEYADGQLVAFKGSTKYKDMLKTAQELFSLASAAQGYRGNDADMAVWVADNLFNARPSDNQYAKAWKELLIHD